MNKKIRWNGDGDSYLFPVADAKTKLNKMMAIYKEQDKELSGYEHSCLIKSLKDRKINVGCLQEI